MENKKSRYLFGKSEAETVITENFNLNGLSDLLDLCFKVAERENDGHFTILKFTTNYKVGLGTPTACPGYLIDGYIENLYEGETLKDALFNFLYGEL